MLNVNVLGSKALIDALNPHKMRASVVKLLKSASSSVMRAAKKNASGSVLKRRSGNLASSITQEVDEGNLIARIGVPGKGNYVRGGKADVGLYGAANEYGATIRPLPPKKFLRFQWAPRGKRPGKNAPWTFTKKTITIPKRPWLRPAYEDNKSAILNSFRAGLERSLKP